jgi:predicted small secreted protein
VLVAVLATAGAFAPAAVLGGAGLELIHPFAVALLGGLVTGTAVVLVLVPGLVAAVGGLRPPPVVGPDSPDGEPDGTTNADHHKHEVRDDHAEARGGTAVMRTGRTSVTAAMFLVGGSALAGCQTVAGAGTDPADAPAVVRSADDGGPPRLTLIEEAVARLGIETAPVDGQGGSRTIPYAAVVYDAEGGTWTFVQEEPGTYRRAPITISAVDGDRAVLGDGPEPGTEVVTVGAAELVGVEAGISGGE